MWKSRLYPMVPLMALLLAAIACLDGGSRVRRVNELPVLECALPTPDPSLPDAPEPEPEQFFTDFPLETTIRLGGLGGVGTGVYVGMDNLQVDGPFSFEGRNGEAEDQFVACWDVTITNASLTVDYEFFPQLQMYVLEIEDPSGIGTVSRGWTVSQEAAVAAGEAMLADIVPASVDCDDNLYCIPRGGNTQVIRPCTYVPSPDVLRLGYILDPLDDQDFEEMRERNSLGSNVAVWVTESEELCEYGYADPLDIDPEAPVLEDVDGLLARWPVDEPHNITRGYGCQEFFTGELSTACPSSKPWFHNGIDFGKSTGSPYYDVFPVSGNVQHAGPNPTGPDCSSIEGSLPPYEGYGLFTRHIANLDGKNVTVWGAHLSGFLIDAGDSSSPGQVLGEIGSTGCSTGSHLHFSVRIDGVYVDPVTVLP